jgi:chromosome segregation ATPase
MMDITKGIRAEADRAKFFADIIAVVEQYGSLDNAIQERKKSLDGIDALILSKKESQEQAERKASDKLEELEAVIADRSAKAIASHDSLLIEQKSELDASKESVAKIKKTIAELDKSYAQKVSIGEEKLADIESAIVVQSKKLEDIKAAITAIAGR